MWFINDDLPEPDTPVIATNLFNGISIFMSFRLFVFAPEIYMELLLLFLSIVFKFISFSYLRYCAVIDFFEDMILLRSPSATIDPPWMPAPSPRSII